jgi:integrase
MKRVKYLFLRGDVYVYIRKVPSDLVSLEKRKFIKVSLKTSDYDEAVVRNIKVNKETEKYFETLIASGANTSDRDRYNKAVKRAQYLGLTYKNATEISTGPFDDVQNRLEIAEKHIDNPAVIEAVLGGVDLPKIRLSNLTSLYFDLAKGDVKDKNAAQLRIWKNSRTNAVKNLIGVAGDRVITELTTNDGLNFRDYWLERLSDEGLSPETANKQFGHIDRMTKEVCEHNRLTFSPIFSGLRFKDVTSKKPRLPFTTDFILNKLLVPGTLKGLSEAGQLLIHLMAETGARPAELIGVDVEQELYLDQEIPYFHIKKNGIRTLKTRNSEREIPLIGYSLEAAKNGAFNSFKKYHENSISLTNLIGLYFRRQNLLPSDQHTLYSLRHSFEDRMTAADVPERIKAQLMGHQYVRPTYGQGGTLGKRLEWMKKFCLKA